MNKETLSIIIVVVIFVVILATIAYLGAIIYAVARGIYEWLSTRNRRGEDYQSITSDNFSSVCSECGGNMVYESSGGYSGTQGAYWSGHRCSNCGKQGSDWEQGESY